MIVIETKDAVLVANKDSSQNLKNAVSLMKMKDLMRLKIIN